MRIVVDKDKCIGCGKCELRCPKLVYRIDEKTNKADPYRADWCLGCFICTQVCPTNALNLFFQ